MALSAEVAENVRGSAGAIARTLHEPADPVLDGAEDEIEGKAAWRVGRSIAEFRC